MGLKEIVFCLLIGLNYSSTTQDLLSNRLLNHLDDIDSEEFVKIRITFSESVDCFSLKQEMISLGYTNDERAKHLIQTLQEKSVEEQANLLHFMKENSPIFKNITSFWIINMLSVETTKEGIMLLNEFENIELIDENSDKLSPLDPIVEHPTQNKSVGGIEPGLDVINIRPLWDLGYTGKGTVAYSYDTGVWTDHPSIKKNFLGNYVPLEQAFYGYWSNLPNGNISSHGTHTTGTMMGLDTNTSDTIGVAWNAYFIANDLVTSTVEELPPIDEMILAFEWALNPDGDLNTSKDIPDVINNSWRWYDDPNTEYCNGIVVDLMNALEAAGIALVFSGGNAGPSNTTISSPQRINTSIVNTFSVGSINANNASLPISSFSSRGPKQCPTAGDSSLIIHPEVVAPGQEVRSAWGTDSYNSISGTSMAAPHVSGVVLLLKEAFPELSGEEILTALYFTATDMGVLGEDNIYGMGLINAFEAYNYLALSHTPTLPQSGVDVNISSISFDTPYTCSNDFTYDIIVKNTGSSTAYDLFLNYGSTESIIDTILLDSLLPNEAISITIPNHSFSQEGSIDLSVTIFTSNDDIDLINNTRIVRTNYRPLYQIPYLEQFEPNQYDANLYYFENGNMDVTWDTMQFSSGIPFSESALIIPFGFDMIQNAEDGFVSPQFFLPNDQDSLILSFDYCYNHRNVALSDSMEVLISDNCGSNWSRIFYKGGNDLTTVEDSESNFYPSSIDHWNNEIISLDSYAGSDVMIKFRSKNRRGNNLFLDNLRIFGNDFPSGINSDYAKLSIAPNPSSGELRYQTNILGLVKIKIFDSQGRLMISEVSQSNGKVNIHHLSNGIYVFQLSNDHHTISNRIVKFSN